MDTYQAFLLGLMVAYTPSLIFVAWMLWSIPSENKHALPRHPLRFFMHSAGRSEIVRRADQGGAI